VGSETARGVEAECQYYRSLLDLGLEEEPEPLLERALALLIDLTEAREGYIELRDDADGALPQSWSVGCGVDDTRVAEIRATISHGIIAEAIATGETVVTASAQGDPRFGDRESVRDHAIEAVVCAPIGRDLPIGVVYLQGGGDDFAVFAEATQRHIRYFGRSIAPFLERAIERRRAAEPLPETGPFADVIYRSDAMKAVVDRLRLAAPLDVHLLFTGPTGVGKTLLAKSVHRAGPRAAGPFVELNCAAVPEALFENELFGAVEGGHSGVPSGGVRGKIAAAEQGTLFLDEVGELGLGAQAKLLQMLQSGTYYRLGSSEPQRAAARVIAATNRDLEAEVEAKRFREDLFYRLDVMRIRVPPLSEREEDLPVLARALASAAAERHGLPVRRLSAGALRAVLLVQWPGNVRELANRLESAVLNAHMRSSRFVEEQDIFQDRPAQDEPVTSLQEATRRFQRRHVTAVLHECDWNGSEAARRLDVARSHVYNLIRLHGLERRE